MRSGYIELITTTTTFKYAGYRNHSWSITANDYTNITTANAFYLAFNSYDLFPSNIAHRWYAFSLRCLKPSHYI